jgi:hypothetical protein
VVQPRRRGRATWVQGHLKYSHDNLVFVDTLGTKYSIILGWRRPRRLSQNLHGWLSRRYYLSRGTWPHTSGSPMTHPVVRVSSRASTWPCSHDTSRPAHPAGASFRAPTWTHTHGSIRTSPAWQMRSGDNTWHHAHITSNPSLCRGKVRTSHVAPHLCSHPGPASPWRQAPDQPRGTTPAQS